MPEHGNALFVVVDTFLGPVYLAACRRANSSNSCSI
jgi:hypothetical protein